MWGLAVEGQAVGSLIVERLIYRGAVGLGLVDGELTVWRLDVSQIW